MSDAKPVDLAEVRWKADVIEDYGRDDWAAPIRTMANEIDALRRGLSQALAVIDSTDGAGLFTETRWQLRALLPEVKP